MNDFIITFIFLTSSLVFIALAIQSFFLYRMYLYGYLRIRNSKIIYALTKLFFWKFIGFLDLMLLSLAGFFQNKEVGLWLRLIGVFIFMFNFYYLYQFSRWSIEKEIYGKEKRRM